LKRAPGENLNYAVLPKCGPLDRLCERAASQDRSAPCSGGSRSGGHVLKAAPCRPKVASLGVHFVNSGLQTGPFGGGVQLSILPSPFPDAAVKRLTRARFKAEATGGCRRAIGRAARRSARRFSAITVVHPSGRHVPVGAGIAGAMAGRGCESRTAGGRKFPRSGHPGLWRLERDSAP
jgi:hypothetical protein